jgi:antitoxin (DNA-binding transcriptional repressor) of toxin-antitoxin stability system
MRANLQTIRRRVEQLATTMKGGGEDRGELVARLDAGRQRARERALSGEAPSPTAAEDARERGRELRARMREAGYRV